MPLASPACDSALPQDLAQPQTKPLRAHLLSTDNPSQPTWACWPFCKKPRRPINRACPQGGSKSGVTHGQHEPKPVLLRRRKIMSCRTNCCKTFSLIFALLAMAVLAAPAFAQTCLQDEYNLSGHNQKLN